MKEIIKLQETEAEYRATVNGDETIVSKNTFEILNGVREHPRMLAIKKAASKANLTDWILLNV